MGVSSSPGAIMTKRVFGLTENKDGDGNEESEKIIGRFKKSNLGKLNIETIVPLMLGDSVSCSSSELDVAATKLQKFYKSYRTRRSLADCAVLVEELWWKALGSFDHERTETAVSRWARGGSMAAKVGKGLSKDDKAQKLALRHWLEAIDPRHRYGHNLHLYYNVWFESSSCQPFFYWLDVGDGTGVSLDNCPRVDLQHQCITYLEPKEREEYEVIVEKGKLVYKQSETLVNTREGSKWIFVLGTSRNLYVGEKKKGHFQHSSFLSGGAIIAAGRLVARDGLLEAIWAYSGHYRPTEENFTEFINFLEEHQVELTNVKKYPIDDDIPPKPKVNNNDCDHKSGSTLDTEAQKSEKQREVRKWTTGAGPRIGCVRDYPTKLQFEALEQLNLSPRTVASGYKNGPIPSPRPTPNVHLSPRIASTIGMGLATPTLHA